MLYDPSNSEFESMPHHHNWEDPEVLCTRAICRNVVDPRKYWCRAGIISSGDYESVDGACIGEDQEFSCYWLEMDQLVPECKMKTDREIVERIDHLLMFCLICYEEFKGPWKIKYNDLVVCPNCEKYEGDKINTMMEAMNSWKLRCRMEKSEDGTTSILCGPGNPTGTEAPEPSTTEGLRTPIPSEE